MLRDCERSIPVFAFGFVAFGMSSFILRPAGMCLAEWVPVRHIVILT